jgi:hypothetical protein
MDTTQYTIISPLGPRNGPATFDCVYNDRKYKNYQEAVAANDFAMINFVQDEAGIIYLEVYHTKIPKDKRYHRLNIQKFPKGIDAVDEAIGITMAETFIKVVEGQIKYVKK